MTTLGTFVPVVYACVLIMGWHPHLPRDAHLVYLKAMVTLTTVLVKQTLHPRHRRVQAGRGVGDDGDVQMGEDVAIVRLVSTDEDGDHTLDQRGGRCDAPKGCGMKGVTS